MKEDIEKLIELCDEFCKKYDANNIDVFSFKDSKLKGVGYVKDKNDNTFDCYIMKGEQELKGLDDRIIEDENEKLEKYD